MNKKIFIYLILVCGSIGAIGPFYWLVSTAFKLSQEILLVPPTLFPTKPTLQNFKDVLASPDITFSRLYINSLFVGMTKTLIIIFIASVTGYILGKFKFRGRRLIFMLILMTMMVPEQAMLIPMYIFMNKLGWVDTYKALIIPGLLSPYSIFLVSQYMHSIPNALLDSARIDGCSEFSVYWRIVLPLTAPVLATVGIIKFMWEWESFIWPLVVVQSRNLFTIPLGISFFSNEHWVNYGPVMAVNTLATIPMLIIFIILQKHIIEGITFTGLKI